MCDLRVGARLPIKLPVQSLDMTRRADSDDSSGEESSLDATVPLLRELANRIAKLPTNVSHDTSSRVRFCPLLARSPARALSLSLYHSQRLFARSLARPLILLCLSFACSLSRSLILSVSVRMANARYCTEAG